MNRDEYFMQIALLTAERGTCDRAKVGAVAVKDKRIIMSAYNGSPSSMEHCDDVGHMMENGHCIRTVHAEQNIICQAAKAGISLQDSTIYVTHRPCFHCLKLLISSGVKRVMYNYEYTKETYPTEYYRVIEIINYEVK